MTSHRNAPGSEALARLEGLERAADRTLAEGLDHAGENGGIPSDSLVRLLEVSRAMNRIHKLDELLAYVSDRLRELFDAENSFVILFDESGRPRIESSHLEKPCEDALPVSETILNRVRATRQPVLIDNAAELEELRNQSSIERFQITSVLCAPLVVGDCVIGVLQFDHRGDPHPFPTSDLRLVALFADQAATAFNNLQLIDRLNGALTKVEIAQKRIVQAERLAALGEMAAGIAHDFNNTLFVALGFCDVLLAHDALDSEVRNSLEKIRTCALDAANTVRRLQVFARGNMAEIRTELIDCRSIAEEMPDFTRHKWHDEAQRNGISITMRTALESTPFVVANPADIREVLTNLIFNAVDAVREDGTIEISSGVDGERVFVAVEDTGVGMDESTRNQAFEPFFTTKGSRGSGFGLSTCWSIAHRLGGELRCLRSEPGLGSRFVLLLPQAGEQSVPPAETPSPSASSARVLIIDDDPEVLETVKVLISTLGHRVEAFTRGDEALERFAEQDFDVVVSDLGMPGLNGFDVARRVSVERPDVPVIILTGWGSDNEPDDVAARSVVCVLPKPITLDALKLSLNQALARGG